MKIRIASLMLASGLLLALIPPAFADTTVETEPVEAAVEPEVPAVFYLDGEPLYHVVAQCIKGTYYVTLASIMPALDPSAIVEEWGGTATLTAQAVAVTETEPEPTETDVLENPTIYGYLLQPAQEEAAPEAVAEVLDTLTMTAAAGQDYLVANGRYLYVKDEIITLDGSVAVPVRLLAEALNMTVSYDAAAGIVSLSRSAAIGYLEDGETYYDADEVNWLSRIIYCESGNQTMAGKIAVGNVVLNRVNHWQFPDTIYDVIFQKNQFSPVGSGSIYSRTPNLDSVVAAKLVLDGAVVLENVLFFNQVGLRCYASRNRSFVATIGGHSFYE